MTTEHEALKKYRMPLLFAAGLLALSFVLLVRTSTVADMYCGLCHEREHSLVKTSFAHNLGTSSCVSCHDESVFSLSKHFSSDPAAVNGKCVGCHSDIQQSKEVKKRKIIKMDHLAHMDGKKTNMKCVECHSNVAHDHGSYATNRPSMTSCFAGECHVKEKDLKKCDYCHYAKLVFPEKQR